MPCEFKIYLFTEHQLREMLTKCHTAGFLDGWNSAECTYPPDSSFSEISKNYAKNAIKEINESEDDVELPWGRIE